MSRGTPGGDQSWVAKIKYGFVRARRRSEVGKVIHECGGAPMPPNKKVEADEAEHNGASQLNSVFDGLCRVRWW